MTPKPGFSVTATTVAKQDLLTAFATGGPSFELASIVRDPRAQPRVELNTETVDAYREVMAESKGWGAFPPVVVFGPEGGRYYLADGFHRMAAAEAAGVSLGRAEVRAGGLREAILYSVGANADHGLRRTNADKKRAVLTLLEDPEWSKRSDHWIAEQAAVSHMTVGRLRADLEATGTLFQSSERVGRDGRTLDTSKIGTKNPSSLPTGTEFQSTEESTEESPQESPSAPSGKRTRRTTRNLGAIESVLAALRETEPAKGNLSIEKTQEGVVALLSWAAGGSARKARSFLQKLGVKPPSGM
ncbi:MAG: ParB/RepB/Spo0J family partition protein [Polyangiaceae bacterium]|jgi:hypothetical protein|nr:ParB/RepB/Spo0J family partition protein [Polyangiaceae bacterium]